jgi:hypothetical protein
MTEAEYILQLSRWFPIRNSYLNDDFIDPYEFENYFGKLTPAKFKVPPFPAERRKYAFIKYCYDNNLCEYDLDSAYTLWVLSLE